MRLSDKQVNLLVGSALLALLPLAWLQYRWISEVSEADQQRRRAALSAALERIAADADRDANRLVASVAAPLSRSVAPDPPDDGLPFLRLLVIRHAEPDDWQAELWNEETRAFEPAPRPAWWRDRPFRNGPIVIDPPALLSPLGPIPSPAWAVIELDAPAIESEYLPALIRRHLGPSFDEEYAVAIRRRDTPPAPNADASAGIIRQLRRSGPLLDRLPPRRGGRKGRPFGGPPPTDLPSPGIWRLEATHRAGTLDAAVRRTRNRNLAVSAATLLLLASALVALGFALRRARRLARLQLEFTAGVSHELRTPLAVIVSAGDNLAGGYVKQDARIREYGALVRDEGARLTAMVEQILRFSSLESGQAPLDRRPVPLAPLLAGIESELRPPDCDWQLTVSGDTVTADPDALRAALRNLVENALRHGSGNWLRLSVDASPSGATFTVEDNGPGIPAADLPHIFDPFYRGAASRAAQRKGSGIGLALVRRIALAHGGAIHAANRPEGGARFTLTLPGS
jgi:signal transduction histidine kinase